MNLRPGEDSDNELEGETQLQRTSFDISSLPPDHTILIHLRKLRTNFPFLMEKILKLCTRGGTRIYGKESTFYDPRYLGFVLRFIGSFRGRKVSTSFFFLKEDMYLIALCRSRKYRVGSNWLCAYGAPVNILGSRPAGFSVHYGRLNDCKVGFDEFRQALFQLSFYNNGASFLKIAHHFSEAVRNKEVEDTVSESFRIGMDLPIDHLITHFHHWQTYTKMWRRIYFQLNSQKQKRYFEMFRELGIKNIDHLGELVQILRMENQEKRKERRSIALGLYSQRSVSHDSIVKRIINVALGAQQLQAHREAILNELMRSGGDRDIWICIKDALRERDLRYAKLKIQHTDLFVRSRDLSECVDDEGYPYVIVDELMLCDL